MKWIRIYGPGIFLMFLFFLCIDFPIGATEYGKNKSEWPIRYYVPLEQQVNVRDQPSTQQGKPLFQVQQGDYIYVDHDTIYKGSGYEWVQISGNQGYLVRKFLEPVENPYFYDSDMLQIGATDLRKTHEITKWVLAFLILGLLIFGVCTKQFSRMISIFWGKRDEQQMRKRFFFNYQPYTSILLICGYIGGSILASVLALFLIGAGVYILFWIIKIVLILLLIIGGICLIGGILTIVFEKTFKYWYLILIGGVAFFISKPVENFTEALVEAGLSFFHELNMLAFASDLFMIYWRIGLTIMLTPLIIFLALALIYLFFAGLMMLTEWILTYVYNIKNPCPVCHFPSEPARYLSQSLVLPVRLRPGPYGLLYIRHPETGERMPTMLLNGRDKLPRECPRCEHVIRAKVGEEKHITLVGLPQSGKTTLIYRMIAEIIREFGEKKVHFTDEVRNSTKESIYSIVQSGSVNEFPAKTNSAKRHHSTQLLMDRSSLGPPYCLYINDVAGEIFTTHPEVNSLQHTPFFMTTQSVVFLLDPYTTYFGNLSTGEEFNKWYEKNVGDRKTKQERKSSHTDLHAKANIEDVFINLKNLIEYKNRKTDEIHFNLVLVKKDTGYLQSIDIHSSQKIREFILRELDLENHIIEIEKTYASVSYHAVSAIEEGEASHIRRLYSCIFEQIHLKL